jgi:hypothetical protein
MEQQLVSFGNFLLSRYGVMVHSTDGKNAAIHQREVSHADVENWSNYEGLSLGHTHYPSRHSLNQVVGIKFKESMEPMNATVIGIHFYEGKVKYDVSLWLGDGSVDDTHKATRVYNVDSCFILPQ